LNKMSVEDWRQVAYEIIPMFRRRIDEAEDVGMLWVDLSAELENTADEPLYLDRPLDEETILSLFRYASWCISSGDEKAQNAAIVEFYERLPVVPCMRRDLHKFMSAEEFLGLKELFEYHLSKEGHEEFIQEFLSRASRGTEGQVGTGGEP
jgi:hypothetical protein